MEMRIRGTDGPDELFATTRDTLLGGAGDDTLDTTAGGRRNWLAGQQGDDVLLAGSNDRLRGGAGNDNLFVGSGRAQMVGGAGADGFWIVDGELPEQRNTVRDFQQGTDVLGLRGLTPEMLRSLRVSQVNRTDTLVQIDGEDVAILKNIDSRTLTMDDFFVAPPPQPPEPPEPAESLLEEILDRGFLRVAVTGEFAGLDFFDEDGELSGLTVDMSRAVATALFASESDEFDPDDFIEYVEVDFLDGFDAVASKEVDLGAISATQNTTRDGTLGVDYSPTILFDGSGVLVRADSGITEFSDLEGLTIGVGEGFVDGPNLLDGLENAGIEAFIEILPDTDALLAAYDAGALDAISLAGSILSSSIDSLSEPDNQLILDEVLGEQPIGLLVPENESEFADVVRWAVYTTFQAEEFGIDSDNVEDFLDSDDPEIQSFLGSRGDLGEALGIDNDFTVSIIEEVGNYGEIYDRHFDEDLLPRGQNAQWTEGGLIYSLPFTGQTEPDFDLIDNDDRNVLEEVLDRGSVIVGIGDEGLDDFSDSLGLIGFNLDLGRAIGAAIFGDPEAAEFVLVEDLGFSEVANGEVDVLNYSLIHNLGRDASLGVDYSPIFVYDNQIVATLSDDIDSLEDLDGGTIGVQAGTPFEENILEVLEAIDADIEVVLFETFNELFDAAVSGDIDAATADSSSIASAAVSLPPELRAEGKIIAAGLSKAPVSLVVDENQSQWRDIVSNVVYATLQAQDFGITSENLEEFLDSEDPIIRRFLGVEGTVGQRLGLPNDFVQNIISSVGNIDEISERNFPGLIRNPLADLSENGGLLFSIPFDEPTRDI
ncbi:MAG: transporter substrate-binding domain-containing protein [Hormoscilla sp.]